jgi:hypothetical protein
MKFKELNETDKKVIKFAYFTKLLVRLSRLKEQDLPLQSSNMAYDRGSTRWSVERADEDIIYLRLFTKGSKVSKFICLKIQDRVLFADYKARKRGLNTNDSFTYKIADVVFDEYGDVVYDSDNNLHLLAYESVGNILFEDLVEQALKLAKDMKISTNEINKDLDFQTHVYEQLGYFQK